MARRMGSKTISAFGFNGMANLRRNPAYLLDDFRRITPAFVLNAKVLDDGRVVRRKGYVLEKAVPGVHSVAGEEKGLSVMLGVAPGSGGGPALFLFDGTAAQELGAIGGPLGAPLDYVEAAGNIYLANGYWTGRLNLSTMKMEEWGLPLPPMPEISMASGELPPGVYKVCYTYYETPNRLSGNGPLVEVAWDGGSMGLRLNNLPPNGLAWITQPNGKEFYLAPVQDGIIRKPYYVQPLLSFGVQPPPPLRHICLAFGRIWGVMGCKLYYSEEFQYEWFRPDGFLPLPEELLMIAPVSGGLFVSSLKSTWFLAGTSPGKMRLERVGSGAVPGTLMYALVEGSGYELSKRFSRMPTPVWATKTGIVVGTHSGNIVHLTEGNLRLNPRARGAALYRHEDGQPSAIISLWGTAYGEMDRGLVEINSRKRLYIPAPQAVKLAGGIVVGGEGEYS